MIKAIVTGGSGAAAWPRAQLPGHAGLDRIDEALTAIGDIMASMRVPGRKSYAVAKH